MIHEGCRNNWHEEERTTGLRKKVCGCKYKYTCRARPINLHGMSRFRVTLHEPQHPHPSASLGRWCRDCWIYCWILRNKRRFALIQTNDRVQEEQANLLGELAMLRNYKHDHLVEFIGTAMAVEKGADTVSGVARKETNETGRESGRKPVQTVSILLRLFMYRYLVCIYEITSLWRGGGPACSSPSLSAAVGGIIKVIGCSSRSVPWVGFVF